MNVVLFLVGVFVGMALHRLIMAMVLEKSPDTLCAYCEWLGRKRRRHKRLAERKEKADYRKVFQHFGINLEEYRQRVQETGGSLNWKIGEQEAVEQLTGNMAGFGAAQSQRIIIDYDKDYDVFLVRQEIGLGSPKSDTADELLAEDD